MSNSHDVPKIIGVLLTVAGAIITIIGISNFQSSSIGLNTSISTYNYYGRLNPVGLSHWIDDYNRAKIILAVGIICLVAGIIILLVRYYLNKNH